MVVTPTFQGIDDNPSNDDLNCHYTVAHLYFDAHHLLVGMLSVLGTSTDTSLSMANCHIGQGQFSSYGNNLKTDLMTPIDMSDIVANPTRTNGLTFFMQVVLSRMMG